MDLCSFSVEQLGTGARSPEPFGLGVASVVFYSSESVVVYAGDTLVVDTGVYGLLSEGYFGTLGALPGSVSGLNSCVVSGLVPGGMRHRVRVTVSNWGAHRCHIRVGSPLCMMLVHESVVCRVERAEGDSLPRPRDPVARRLRWEDDGEDGGSSTDTDFLEPDDRVGRPASVAATAAAARSESEDSDATNIDDTTTDDDEEVEEDENEDRGGGGGGGGAVTRGDEGMDEEVVFRPEAGGEMEGQEGRTPEPEPASEAHPEPEPERDWVDQMVPLFQSLVFQITLDGTAVKESILGKLVRGMLDQVRNVLVFEHHMRMEGPGLSSRARRRYRSLLDAALGERGSARRLRLHLPEHRRAMDLGFVSMSQRRESRWRVVCDLTVGGMRYDVQDPQDLLTELRDTVEHYWRRRGPGVAVDVCRSPNLF
ncbi:GP3 [Guinea pig adenovirus]|nr:GP3 [Guinea pig adenovirus]